MTAPATPADQREKLPNYASIYAELEVARENLNRRHMNNYDACAGRSARAVFSAMCLLDTARALLSSPSVESVRRDALEEAAKVADEWAQERWAARAKTFAAAGHEVARRIRALPALPGEDKQARG